MSLRRPKLEAQTLAALANAAAVDLPTALAALDAVQLAGEDFSEEPLRRVWAVMEPMLRDNRVPDMFAVEALLGASANRALLSELFLSQDSGHPLERMRLMRDLSDRRKALESLRRVAVVLQDTTQTFANAISEAGKALQGFEGKGEAARPGSEDVFALLDHLEQVQAGTREPVLRTGIEALDGVIGGLQPTLTIIGALPGVGKSAVLASILRNLGGNKVRCGLLSLEDERGWLTRRLLAEAAAVPLFVLANRPLTSAQKRRIDDTAQGVYDTLQNIIIDGRPALGVPEVVASAREMVTRYGAKAILVDHLGEIRLQRSDRHDLDIADALLQLRAIAKTYRVPVVVACHLKRREGLGIDSEPRLTDFAFSAAVERMARVALGLSRNGENGLTVHVLKQTNGQAGVSVDLRLNGPAGTVLNGDPRAVSGVMEKRYQADEEEMLRGR